VVESPLLDDPFRLAGKAAADDLAVGDPHECLETLIAGVEMRRRMVVEIHPDHDAEEERDYGHYLEWNIVI
jgi:hypothetical protein